MAKRRTKPPETIHLTIEQMRELTKYPASATGLPHTISFYSFKGGVGRTLALLNVATFLAKRGNRVAIADFDLEAPGIDTFDGFRPPAPEQPGIVEFVREYLGDPQKKAPSALGYVYKAKNFKFDEPGEIYVLRAGRMDQEYRKSLASFDWNQLFGRFDGQLLFNNLKAELFKKLGCNYLLIDSRTGLTDVAGMCTGLLADGVVFLFYPDEQNMRGIRAVAQAVQAFSKQSERRIDRMYCVSRVPDVKNVRDKALGDARHLVLDLEAPTYIGELGIDFSGPPKLVGWTKSPYPVNSRMTWKWDQYSAAVDIFVTDVCRWPLMRATLDCYESSDQHTFFSLGGPALAFVKDEKWVDFHGISTRDACEDGPYAQIATFSAVGNVFDHQQLKQVGNAIYPEVDVANPPSPLQEIQLELMRSHYPKLYQTAMARPKVLAEGAARVLSKGFFSRLAKANAKKSSKRGKESE